VQKIVVLNLGSRETLEINDVTPFALMLRDVLYEGDWELMNKEKEYFENLMEEVKKLQKLERYLGVELDFQMLGPFVVSEFVEYANELGINLASLNHVSLNYLYDRAFDYADMKYYDLAEKVVSLMLKIDPNYAPAYELLGTLYIEQGNEEGVNYLKKAIEIDPLLIGAYSMLGEHYYNSGRYREAAQVWLKELEMAPEHKFTYFMVADAYDRCGEYRKAVEILEKFVTMDNRSILALYEISQFYRKMGNDRKADEYEKLILERIPYYINDVEVWARIMFKHGRYEEVEKVVKNILENTGEHAALELLLIVPYVKMGRLQEARSILDKYKTANSWLYYGKQNIICESLNEEEKRACGLNH